MVKAVQELESGIDAETVARNHGISKATLYNWKSKYSGMEVSQVRRLKELEEENVTFRKIDDHTWVGSGNVMSSETMATELIEGKANGTNEVVHGTGMDRVLVRDGFRLNYNAARLETEREQ